VRGHRQGWVGIRPLDNAPDPDGNVIGSSIITSVKNGVLTAIATATIY